MSDSEKTPEEWHDWEAAQLEHDLRLRVPGLEWKVLRMEDKAQLWPAGVPRGMAMRLDVCFYWQERDRNGRLLVDRILLEDARMPAWEMVWLQVKLYLRRETRRRYGEEIEKYEWEREVEERGDHTAELLRGGGDLFASAASSPGPASEGKTGTEG
jgi:hypothetical protein